MHQGTSAISIKLFVHIALLISVVATCGCPAHVEQDRFPEYDEPWAKYDEAVEEAKKNQQYDLAEENQRRRVEEYVNRGFKDTYSGIEFSKIYVEQGRYPEAAAGRLRAFPLCKDKMPLYEISLHYRYLAEIYLAQGRFDEAGKEVEKAMASAEELARTEPHNAGFKINMIYPVAGEYHLQRGNYEKSWPYFKEAVDFGVNNHLLGKDVAIAKNRLAMAYYCAGNDVEAEKLFREGAGLNANAMIGFPKDLAQSLTMLGKIAGRRGQGDKALEFYQSARKALHSYRTLVYKVEESDVLGQIGRFYVKQGQADEAAQVYGEAIRLRTETATQPHPNCADALKGLADVAALRSELTSATLQVTQALKILDAALVHSHPRIAPELVALASIHVLAGQPEQAASLDARLETILQKPLGPWKEDFMETTKFYAGLLKKAGKNEEAGRLERIQPRK